MILFQCASTDSSAQPCWSLHGNACQCMHCDTGSTVRTSTTSLLPDGKVLVQLVLLVVLARF
jgi:hypothetical protein